MIEMLAVAGGTLVAGLSYLYGKMRAEHPQEGCNGHHWGEPNPAVDKEELRDGRSALGSTAYMSATTRNQGVVLSCQAIKTCKDCGDREETTVTLGKVSYDQFVDE